MSYDALRERLAADGPPDARVLAFPDGSVDRCYAVIGLAGERLTSREAFGRQLAEGAGDAFAIEPTATRPGGQAVNAAIQADRLGAAVTLAGHLDHPVLEGLPFETRSFGEPARIRVLAFEGEEVFLSEPAPGRSWGVAAFESAIDSAALASADACCCTNWVSYRGVVEVLERLGDPQVGGNREGGQREGVPLVVDPGALGQATTDALGSLFDALAAAEARHRVVLSANRLECEAAARAVGVTADEDDERVLARLRSRLGISAIVLQGSEVAVAATDGGTAAVDMLPVDEVVLTTGAGDRFSGALATALGSGWAWEAALALANACAAHFVGTGKTGDPDALETFLRDRV